MAKYIPVVPGARYGKRVVLGPGTKPGHWQVRCDCGDEQEIRADGLRTHSACTRCAWTGTHGQSKTPEYRIWSGMITRCYNPNWEHYAHYGGRGITVCPEWRHSFEQFLADMGPRPTPKHSLERVNRDGPYAAGNCRWATHQDQMRNRSNSTFFTHAGRTQTAAAWAEEAGMKTSTFWERLRRGWSLERTLTEPVAPWSRPRK